MGFVLYSNLSAGCNDHMHLTHGGCRSGENVLSADLSTLCTSIGAVVSVGQKLCLLTPAADILCLSSSQDARSLASAKVM